MMGAFSMGDILPNVVTTGLVPVVQGRSGIAWIAGTSPAMTMEEKRLGLETEVPAFAGMTRWSGAATSWFEAALRFAPRHEVFHQFPGHQND